MVSSAELILLKGKIKAIILRDLTDEGLFPSFSSFTSENG
jgi:hypothetical protein